MYVCASPGPAAEAVSTTLRVCASRVAWMWRLNLPMTSAVCQPLRSPTTWHTSQVWITCRGARRWVWWCGCPWPAPYLKQPIVEDGLLKRLFRVVVCLVIAEAPQVSPTPIRLQVEQHHCSDAVAHLDLFQLPSLVFCLKTGLIQPPLQSCRTRHHLARSNPLFHCALLARWTLMTRCPTSLHQPIAKALPHTCSCTTTRSCRAYDPGQNHPEAQLYHAYHAMF